MNVYIDFEMNEIHNNKGEIISIGAIKVENDIIIDTFHTKVCPVKSDYIKPIITVMTGIKYEDLINAPYFNVAFKKFLDWSGNVDNIYCWGSADIDSIYYTYGLEKHSYPKVYKKIHPKIHQVIQEKFVDLRNYIEVYDYHLSRLSLLNLYQGMMNKKIDVRKLHEPVFDSTILFEIHSFFKDKLAREKFQFSKEGSVLDAKSL